MFTETSEFDLIQVLLDGQIQVRRADKVLKDGVEISKSYWRAVLAPGESVSSYPANVQAIAAVVWTPEVVAAYAAAQAARAQNV
jgi:hypothetical protein